MIKIKICGLRRIEDIDYVNKYRPDYAGFVFSKSRRRINLEQGKKLISNLNSNVKTVGIFVDESPDYVESISNALKLDIVQFHGSEDNKYMKCFNKFEIWKALKVRDKSDILNLNYEYADGIVLDSSTAGSGKSFEWSIARDFKFDGDLILAGGLDPENVESAVRIVNPDIVDVSSGVETSGYKDPDKIKKFILKVRNIE
ncbi:phosphoribosylanthranilate isomerase [Clostridium sp. LBM24168]